MAKVLLRNDEEWPRYECQLCQNQPPPTFLLPPPPCPPDFQGQLELPLADACPRAVTFQEKAPLPSEKTVKSGILYIVTGTILLLSTVIILAVCGYRLLRSRAHKQRSASINGAIIYDDLSLSPRFHPLALYNGSSESPSPLAQIRPQTLRSREFGKMMTQGDYISGPKVLHIPTDHLYSSISSGSGSDHCTCSTSDGVLSEFRSLLSSHPRYSPSHTNSDSEEDDSLAPFLAPSDQKVDYFYSPSRGKYYSNVPLTSLRPSTLSSHYYDAIPMSQRRTNLTLHHSMVPKTSNFSPVPSRVDQFRNSSGRSRSRYYLGQNYRSVRREPLGDTGIRPMSAITNIYEDT